MNRDFTRKMFDVLDHVNLREGHVGSGGGMNAKVIYKEDILVVKTTSQGNKKVYKG